jgi:hypothetical protein
MCFETRLKKRDMKKEIEQFHFDVMNRKATELEKNIQKFREWLKLNEESLLV